MLKTKTNLIVATGFFFFWLLVLLAGADFPPPPGFVWIVLIDALSALVVYLRMSYYFRWIKIHRKHRFLLVVLDGLAAGFTIALVVMLFSPGEPSVEPGLVDHLIWFAVLGSVGVFNSGVIYAICAVLAKRGLAGE